MMRLRIWPASIRKWRSSFLPKDLDVTKMRRFAEDEIEALFERVAGVSQANVIGGLEDEMQVIIDPQKLAARQLTIADVRRVLIGQNADTSSGDYWEGQTSLGGPDTGAISKPGAGGRPVSRGARWGPGLYPRRGGSAAGLQEAGRAGAPFGESSISVNALRETGANVLDVMRGCRR
jgi:hydrophobic/amphiphilic exporter-1 (mainly G- bacteria), HAE1 family